MARRVNNIPALRSAKPSDAIKEYLSVAEEAQRLGVSKNSIYYILHNDIDGNRYSILDFKGLILVKPKKSGRDARTAR